MTLDTTFRHADIVKAKKVKDADGDGLVYDGTPRERPALPDEKLPGARKPAARAAKVPRRPKSPLADEGGAYEVSGVKGNRIDIRQSPSKEAAEAEGKKMVAEGYKDVVAKPKRKAPAKAPAKKPPGGNGKGVALAPEDIARPDNKPAKVPKKLKSAKPDPTHMSVDMDQEIPHEEFFGENIFGQDADSNAAEYWRRAMYAAMRGDKDGYLENMDNFFKEEEAIHVEKETDRTEWANSVMDFVDNIFDEADPEGAGMAVDNIEAWGALPSKLRKDRKKNKGKKKPDAEDVASADRQRALTDHLKGGGGIGDAPEGDLVEALRSMPERFDFQYLGAGAGGVSDSFWVVDKKRSASLLVKYQIGSDKNGPIYNETEQELFFIKKSAFQDDVLAEVMAGKILSDTDLWDYSIDVKWAAPPKGGRGADYVVMPHAGQVPGQTVWIEMNEEAMMKPGTAHILDISDGVDAEGEFDGIGAIVRDGPDPGSYLRMNLYDWFINNSEDRHWKNLLAVVGDGGVYIAPIDQGLAFWNGGDTPDAPLDRYLNSNWRNRPIDNMVNAVEILEGDRGKVLAEIENMNEKMKKADVPKMKADLKSGPPKMDERMAAMIDVWFDGMQSKIDWMAANPEEAADVVMKAGKPRKGRRK